MLIHENSKETELLITFTFNLELDNQVYVCVRSGRKLLERHPLMGTKYINIKII